MTAGLPGAGIGGLFYLASTLLLPVRSLVRRVRGQPEVLGWRGQSHSVLIALGIIAGLWSAGWLLALVIPAGMRPAPPAGSGSVNATGTILPVATFGIGVATLVIVLLSVEVAHRLHARRSTRLKGRLTRGAP